jgi:hypothetical protein
VRKKVSGFRFQHKVPGFQGSRFKVNSAKADMQGSREAGMLGGSKASELSDLSACELSAMSYLPDA